MRKISTVDLPIPKLVFSIGLPPGISIPFTLLTTSLHGHKSLILVFILLHFDIINRMYILLVVFSRFVIEHRYNSSARRFDCFNV